VADPKARARYLARRAARRAKSARIVAEKRAARARAQGRIRNSRLRERIGRIMESRRREATRFQPAGLLQATSFGIPSQFEQGKSRQAKSRLALSAAALRAQLAGQPLSPGLQPFGVAGGLEESGAPGVSGGFSQQGGVPIEALSQLILQLQGQGGAGARQSAGSVARQSPGASNALSLRHRAGSRAWSAADWIAQKFGGMQG